MSRSVPLAIVRAVRPHQWVKNLFVCAPLVFAKRLGDLDAVVLGVAAVGAFSALSSAVYLVNDLVDREKDRAHPTKRHRPVASGQIPVRAALIGAGGFLVLAMVLASSLPTRFTVIVAGYMGLNVLYSGWLKRVVLVDVFAIAAFFLLPHFWLMAAPTAAASLAL